MNSVEQTKAIKDLQAEVRRLQVAIVALWVVRPLSGFVEDIRKDLEGWGR